MAIKMAVQMDPMDGININGDSSFALMLAGQARGYDIWHYDVGSLTLDAHDRLTAWAHPVHDLQRVEGAHYRFGTPKKIDLGTDIDVVLMRQDPPFHFGYITATHLLERIEHETLVVNNPASVRNAPEKVMVLDYRQFMPPTIITRSADEVRDFQKIHGAVVVKPLHGNGGKAIFRIDADGSNLGALFEVFNNTWPEPHMVQPFLPDVAKGERLIVFHLPMSRDPEEVVKTLIQRGLPKLWVPSADSFAEIEELPILGSGKLDLRHLGEMARQRFAAENAS